MTGIQMPNRTYITPRLSHSYDDMSFVTGESNKHSIFSPRCLSKGENKLLQIKIMKISEKTV